MVRLARRAEDLAASRSRVVAFSIALVLGISLLAAVRHPTARAHANVASGASSATASQAGQPASRVLGSTTTKPVPRASLGEFGAKPGAYVPGIGTVPLGVHGDKITLVYYWKGDRTETSPYLGPTGQRGAVDEGDAFRRLIAYINKYANGGATFMGFPFNLHGRTLDITDPACPKSSCVLDAGQYPETYAATAETITKTIKPFAALSSHGSLSDYVCPALAKAHVFNPVTYNLSPSLYERTGGWCLPQGISWEKQVQLSVAWLTHQARTSPYRTATGTEPRVYGVLYAEYPGLAEQIAPFERRLRAAGVNVALVQSVSADLTTAAREQKTVVENFKAAGVNTIIAPDSGSPITFTQAAGTSGEKFDYYVWPCSGEDAAGQVRLYNSTQWEGASGLSCFDANFNLDLTLDSNARQTQWFRQYREIAGGSQDPPSTTPLVYAGLLPILVGLTNAGPTLTVERFFDGIRAFTPYRYHAVDGPTRDGSHFLVSVGSDDGSQIGDAAEVTWTNAQTTPGNATPGEYLYSSKRYAPGSAF